MKNPEMPNSGHAPLDEALTKIAIAEQRAGRPKGSARLIAISKTRSAEEIRPLLLAGQRIFGENRVQEADAKWPELRNEFGDLELHLVGQLQSNKAEDAVRLFDVIHSLDRTSLVRALAKAMDKQQRRVPCFIQVNIGDEDQKGGCALAELDDLIAAAKSANIDIAGLMCVPPADINPSPFFALLAKLAKDHGLSGLSMGMSSDFETAVTLGATYVRIGTALFGPRG